MKTTIVIQENVTQIVLTGENDWEKSALETLRKHSGNITVLNGQYYNCNGGWMREGSGQDSTILRMVTNVT